MAKYYRKAIELNPNDLMLHYKLATALAATGSIEDAMGCMEKAIEIDPREPYTYHIIGNILYNAKYLDDAISWYKKVSTLVSNFIP
jgi:tetratricopeptide (TPR) repeat protein